MKSLVPGEAAHDTMKASAILPARRTSITPTQLPVALAVLWSALVGFAALGGVAAMQRGAEDDAPAAIRTDVPVAVSPRMLADFAASHGSPVYWAGGLRSRRLELTTTRNATFVRYLPVGVRAGDPRAEFTTIATYPMPNAYATAAGRRTRPGMASRKMQDGGIAVWSRARPTSVYVAYPGVPQLVEVYDDRGRQALRLALSGRLRPVG